MLDWERADLRGLPGHDLIFFLTYVAESRRAAFAREAQLRAFDAAFLGGRPWARRRVERELARLGVDPALLPALVVATFARSSIGLLSRLWDVGPDRGQAIAESFFSLGLALLLHGAITRRGGPLLVGVVVAAAARQTTLVVAPVFALWLLVDRGWPVATRFRRLAAAALIGIVLPFGLYAAVKVLTAGFTRPFAPRVPRDTLLPVLADLPGSAGGLARHLLHVAAPLLVAGGLVATLAVVALLRRVRPPVIWWLALLVAAAVVVQPAATNPDFPGFAGNESRLGALGLLPLVTAAALLVRTLDRALGRSYPGSPVALVAVLVLIAVASLHPVLTVVGPHGSGPFVLVQLVAAAGVAGSAPLAYRARPGSPDHRPSHWRSTRSRSHGMCGMP